MSTENITDSFKYNVPDEGFTGFNDLLMETNTYMNGGLGFGVLFAVFAVSFYRMSRYPNTDALTASGFLTSLTGGFLALIGVVEASIPILLLLLTTGVAAYNARSNR